MGSVGVGLESAEGRDFGRVVEAGGCSGRQDAPSIGRKEATRRVGREMAEEGQGRGLAEWAGGRGTRQAHITARGGTDARPRPLPGRRRGLLRRGRLRPAAAGRPPTSPALAMMSMLGGIENARRRRRPARQAEREHEDDRRDHPAGPTCCAKASAQKRHAARFSKSGGTDPGSRHHHQRSSRRSQGPIGPSIGLPCLVHASGGMLSVLREHESTSSHAHGVPRACHPESLPREEMIDPAGGRSFFGLARPQALLSDPRIGVRGVGEAEGVLQGGTGRGCRRGRLRAGRFGLARGPGSAGGLRWVGSRRGALGLDGCW